MKLINFLLVVFLLQSAFNVAVAAKKNGVKSNRKHPQETKISPEHGNAYDRFIEIFLQELQYPDSCPTLTIHSYEFLKENRVFKLLSFVPTNLAKPISSGRWTQSAKSVEMTSTTPGFFGKMVVKKCYYRDEKNKELPPLLKLIKVWLAKITPEDGQDHHFCWCERGLSGQVTFESFDWYIAFPAAYQFLTTAGWAAQSMEALKEEKTATEESIITSTLTLCLNYGATGFSEDDLLDALPDYRAILGYTHGE